MKVVTQKLNEQVFERIKEMIKDGTYRKGDFLPSENELVEMMGVSRVTVRQALKKLSEAGIIQTQRGKGSIVSLEWKSVLEEGEMYQTSKEYQEIFMDSTRARRLIEPSIARQAAMCASEEDIARMEEAMLYESQETLPLMQAENVRINFHRNLWLAMHNPILMETWEKFSETSKVMNKLPLISPIYRKKECEESIRQHRAILDAIKRGDGDYAYYRMLEHCDWIIELYGQYFDEFLK